MTDTIYSRLLAICKDMALPEKNKSIMQITGLSSGRVSQIKADQERASISEDVMAKLVGIGYSRDWIKSGKGEMKSRTNVEPGPDLRYEVPLISWVEAGTWNHAADPYQPGDAEEWIASPCKGGRRTYALRVRGDSMTSPFGKSYPDGCIIFVDPDQKSPSNGDRVIAKLQGSDEVTFKAFVSDAGKTWLKPLNPQHPPILEPFSILGKVIGKWEPD